jgi:hypothetical protein
MINFIWQRLILLSINFAGSFIKKTIEFLVDLIKWILQALIWLFLISIGLVGIGFAIQNFGVFFVFVIFIFHLITEASKK